MNEPEPRPQRTRRAKYDDVLRLERAVAALTATVDQLQERLDRTKPDDHNLPMTKEMFMGQAILSTLQSGGWSNLKFVDSRAEAAWDAWVRITRKPEPVEA